jgi:Ca-activated chloride channel family protein
MAIYNPKIRAMKYFAFTVLLSFLFTVYAFAQSGRFGGYSESTSRYDDKTPLIEKPASPPAKPEDEIVRVETDLVTVPVRITSKGGRPVPDVKREEFKIFENGIEQTIEYFSSEEQPFTVALMLDMSYSSVFKLQEIQDAAFAFVRQLRPQDKVMVIAFDEKPYVLCEATNNQKALRFAIEASKIGSGTSLYTALDMVMNEKFRRIQGRKAVVILSDGVDTTSKLVTERNILKDVDELDALVYPIQYDTFDDVQKSRRKNAEIRYDEDDHPYVVSTRPGVGERESDYETAREFFNELAADTGGSVQHVTSKTNLDKAFARIADELRKTYSLGYYPSGERKPGGRYSVKVRVYRPNLNIRTRESYIGQKN